MVAYRGAFRTWLNIYNWAFFVKIPNGVKLLTISARKAPSYMFDWVENRFLAKSFTYFLFPTFKLNRKILSQEICVTSFLKRSCWDSKQSQCLCRSSRPKGFLKKVLWEISQSSQELSVPHLCRHLFLFFSCEFCEICKNTCFAEQHRTIASDYSSINSSEEGTAKRNCEFWDKN